MDTNVPPSAITSINGMRVMSMWWVILGHVYGFQMVAPISKYSLVLLWFLPPTICSLPMFRNDEMFILS